MPRSQANNHQLSEPGAAVKPESLSDLIRRRLDPNDPWKLAIVQRHAVWDEVRASRLLDSLIAGYPIGSIMFCRLRQASKALNDKPMMRETEDSPAGSYQLLDGQQRINALASIFTTKGRFGRFFLDMTTERESEEIVTRRRDKRKTTNYIKWADKEEGGFNEDFNERNRYINLSNWFCWAEEKGQSGLEELLETLEKQPEKCLKALNEIDPAFADDLDESIIPIAAARLERLIRIWIEPRIPVQYLTLDGPNDVLQVFSRINLEGVRLDGEDVFFAAVKTLWTEAEEYIDRIVDSTKLLNRMIALRLLARLASQVVYKDDLLPLRVDRLNGEPGKRIISAMHMLAAENSEPLRRMSRLGEALVRNSNLGYALREIHPALFDHIFGWAAVNSSINDPKYLDSQLHEIETYLLGGTIYGYPTVFLDTFSRLAFIEALSAGLKGKPFPTEKIIYGCLRKWPNLERGRRRIQVDSALEEHRNIVDSKPSIFLSFAQRIPYEMPSRDDGKVKRVVEWDHIFAQAHASKMKIGRSYHRYRYLIWSGGNLWALDRPLNNYAREKYPSEKMDFLSKLPDGSLPSRWPSESQAYINEEDIRLLKEAERHFKDNQVEKGMAAFKKFAEGRSLRLYQGLLAEYNRIQDFSKRSNTPEGEYSNPAISGIGASLGLENIRIIKPYADIPMKGYVGFESVLSLAEEIGFKQELISIIDTARAAGLYARPYKWSVMFTHPEKRTIMLFTIWPRKEGYLSISRSSDSISRRFPKITRKRALSLGPDGNGILRKSDIDGFVDNLIALFKKDKD